jgi:peptidoglycan/xylan/chitin deacetylase (PgdA/CDA1 family)
MDHRPWRRLSGGDRERELVHASEVIAGIVGRPVSEAALPTGAYDRRLLRDLKRLRYGAVHTSDRRTAKAGAWLQPRFSVVADDTPESVLGYTRRPSPIRRIGPAVRGLVKRIR